MGGGRGAVGVCHSGPPATIEVVDEAWTGRPKRGQGGFVAMAVGPVSMSIPSHRRTSLYQHPSGGKWRQWEVVFCLEKLQ